MFWQVNTTAVQRFLVPSVETPAILKLQQQYRVQVRSDDRSLPHPTPLPDPTPPYAQLPPLPLKLHVHPSLFQNNLSTLYTEILLQISSEYVQFFQVILTLTLPLIKCANEKRIGS